jgi:hypothetical protein
LAGGFRPSSKLIAKTYLPLKSANVIGKRLITFVPVPAWVLEEITQRFGDFLVAGDRALQKFKEHDFYA